MSKLIEGSLPGNVNPTGYLEKSLQVEDAAIKHVLLRLGENVKKARKKKKFSRRILSEISGVSQRYLAQLESGEGNISIGLLMKIAKALDTRIEWLLADENSLNEESAAIAVLLRTATEKQQRRILKILDPEHPVLNRASRIALVGLRGAGKSTLGKMVGKKLGLQFIELNSEIEQASGMPVEEVFSLYGQEGYRRLERTAIEHFTSSHDSIILETAGGIVEDNETYAYLLRHYHTIWLKAEPEEHMARVRAQGDERPMAGNPNAMKELREILTARQALYAKADAQLDTSNSAENDNLAELAQIIKKKLSWSD